MMRRRIGLVLATVGVGLSLLPSAAESATVRIRAGRLNGEAITPTSYLEPKPGDIVEADVTVSGWGTAIPTVSIFQVILNTDALVNPPGASTCGSVKPLNYDIPELRLSGFFINVAAMGRGVCSVESANAGVSCVSSPVACTNGECRDGFCYGGTNAGLCATPDNQCIDGSCDSRSDFIFGGFSHPLCAVQLVGNYRLACTLFVDNGPPDQSQCIGGSEDGGPCDGDGDCPKGTCDVVEYYVVTIVLEVGPEAAGRFLLDVVPDPGTFFSSPDFVDAPIKSDPLVLHVNPGLICDDFRGACCLGPGHCEKRDEWECAADGGVFLRPFTDCSDVPDFCACPTIVDAMPANCAIDARYPDLPGASPRVRRIGFESVAVTLSAGTEMSVIDPSDFQLSFVGGGLFAPPVVTAVTPLGGTRVRLDFDEPLPVQRWSCLGMVCASAGSKDVCWGHLPGDVNGDGTANVADVLDLIDFLNTVRPEPLEWYQYDVDDSGAGSVADVLGVIDLLNGAFNSTVWNNVATNGGPCPTEP